MRRDDFGIWESVSVRWSDMDAMGHVNNAKYFTYLESARIKFFGVLGIAPPRAEINQSVALASTTCNFRRQVHYPNTLEIGTRVHQIGNSSFQLAHALYIAGEDTPVADAASVVVWVDYREGKSRPLPDAVRERLNQLALPPNASKPA